MSEHTPGPWLYREPEDDELHEIYSEGSGDLICYPVWTHNQRANIPLIAAAPELLVALADTVSRLEMIASDMRGGLLGHNIGLADYEAGVCRCYQRAAAVLAKAGGKAE
jgi:hypothetical protein